MTLRDKLQYYRFYSIPCKVHLKFKEMNNVKGFLPGFSFHPIGLNHIRT
jgi:hypothetical protein